MPVGTNEEILTTQPRGLPMSKSNSDSRSEKALILYFRFVMAWTFLYAASHQVFVPSFTVVGFLNHTKTWHDVFAISFCPSIGFSSFMNRDECWVYG